MTAVQDVSGWCVLLIQYCRGRIARPDAGRDRSLSLFDYLLNQRRMVDETMVTDPAGKTSTFKF
jgi:hypothetical protein